MPDLFLTIFTPGKFEPHSMHFIGNQGLMWFIIIGNALIALSYTLIPFAMIYLVRKRRDIPFNWMLLLYGLFIILCGMTHIVHIMIFFYPAYWLQGIIDILTGIISFATFIAFVYIIPFILKIPSPKQLEETTVRLSAEAEQRKHVEEVLAQSNLDLDIKVKERTKELESLKENLEKTVQERTNSLQQKMDELAKMNAVMVNRETKMIELKNRISELEGKPKID